MTWTARWWYRCECSRMGSGVALGGDSATCVRHALANGCGRSVVTTAADRRGRTRVRDRRPLTAGFVTGYVADRFPRV